MGKFLDILLKKYKLPEQSITEEMVEFDESEGDTLDVASELTRWVESELTTRSERNRQNNSDRIDWLMAGLDPAVENSYPLYFSGTTVTQTVQMVTDKPKPEPKVSFLNKKKK